MKEYNIGDTVYYTKIILTVNYRDFRVIKTKIVGKECEFQKTKYRLCEEGSNLFYLDCNTSSIFDSVEDAKKATAKKFRDYADFIESQ